MVQEILRVDRMRAERDRRAVLEALRGVPGVRRATANLADRIVLVEREEGGSLAAIMRALGAAGYPAAALA